MTNVVIHHRPGTYSDRWISRCDELGVNYSIVDGHSDDVIAHLRPARAFLWHYSHMNPADMLVAEHVLSAAEMMGLVVFPNRATRWHFDDKLAQKYLFESINAPLVPTHAFFDAQSALSWLRSASFPLVFKLRKGAGAKNVQLVKNFRAAERLVYTAFRTGFKPVAGVTADLGTKLRNTKNVAHLIEKLKRLPTTVRTISLSNRYFGRERGYVYFQEFIPGNKHDTRVTIIGRRAFAFTRGVRRNDFRASGSGQINYDQTIIDRRCISIAFDVVEKIGAQSAAFDFVLTPGGEPAIVEVSYSYMSKPVHDTGGYFDRNLDWHANPTWPEDAILDDVLHESADKR